MFSTLYGTNFPFQMHFKMPFAICFNLQESTILSSGNGLNSDFILVIPWWQVPYKFMSVLAFISTRLELWSVLRKGTPIPTSEANLQQTDLVYDVI